MYICQYKISIVFSVYNKVSRISHIACVYYYLFFISDSDPIGFQKSVNRAIVFLISKKKTSSFGRFYFF